VVTAAGLRELLEAGRYQDIKAAFENVPAADAARMLLELPERQRALVFRLLDKDIALLAFEQLEPADQQELLEALQDHEVLHLLEGMSADDRARLLDEMPAKVATRLLARLTPENREATALLLGYAPETAGRIMTPDYISLRASTTAREALEKIRRAGVDSETIYYLYVTDEARRLQGVLSLRQLVLADPDAVVGDLAERNVIHVHTDTDQEQAARLIEMHDLLAIPVVDSENRLVGIVTVDDAVDVLDRETTEDFARLAAMSPAETGDQYFRLSFLGRLVRRLPWLVVLLVAQVLSGGLISLYEQTLADVIALAVFIPMIMATSGNTGAQSVTLAVRGLATGEVEPRHFWRVFAQEIATGFGLGLVLGAVASLVALLITGDPRLGMAVAAAIWGNVIVVGGIGTLLPFILRAARVDPAVASAPLITTLGDAVSLLIYFNAARILYGL